MQVSHNKKIFALFLLVIILGAAGPVYSASAPTITSPSPLPIGTEFTAYSYTLACTTGGGAPYTWTITVGVLPTGLSLNSSTGIISGNPVVSGALGPFTVRVSDSKGKQSAGKSFTMTIKPACALVGTSTGSISFNSLDPSTTPGPLTNNAVTQQVIFQCDASLTYSIGTNPVNPSLLSGSNSIPVTLGLAASGLNATNATTISLLTSASSIIKPNYQNAVAGAYNSGNIVITISWGGTYPGSIIASVTAGGTVIDTCAIAQYAGTLTFTIDPSVAGTMNAINSPDMGIRCTNQNASVMISASSQNGGVAPNLKCVSTSCGTTLIPYTFKILNSSVWPVNAPSGTGFGGAGTPLGISGSVNSADYQNAPVGNYQDVVTITLNY